MTRTKKARYGTAIVAGAVLTVVAAVIVAAQERQASGTSCGRLLNAMGSGPESPIPGCDGALRSAGWAFGALVVVSLALAVVGLRLLLSGRVPSPPSAMVDR